MCGINGIIDFSQHFDSHKIQNLLEIMNNTIVHRGPDESGMRISYPVGLGMRRLAIIDLSTGSQPISNEHDDVTIILNGEIYNYKSLRIELEIKGYKFRTQSDTEVVLQAYLEYDTECFALLKGMFALAIYDARKQKVVLARDRAGEKPLYYYKSDHYMVFASELKSILATDLLRKKISKLALNQYLQLTYIPAPLTIYNDVYKLLPGHYLEISLSGSLTKNQYWDVSYEENNLITDYDQCKRILRETLFNAVEETLVADVPVGTFLSGGIDSTIITGIAHKISGKQLDSFTIGYHQKQFDESNRAKLSSEMHHTNHHVYYLDFNDALSELDKLILNLDEPFADSSYIPTYMVSKFAREHVKTILTGDAGDELFGGYSKYLIGYYINQYNRLPPWARDAFKHMLFKIPDRFAFTRKARKVVNNFGTDIFDQRLSLMCLGFKHNEIKQLLTEEYQVDNSLDFITKYYDNQAETTDELSRALYTDFKVVLEGDMLTKVDRASMLASLETRVPLLHKEVVELAAKIPSKYKINTKNTKIIFKDTFRDLIPKELFNASKKGFGVPIGEWFKHELRDDLIRVLDPEKIETQGIFNSEYVVRIIDEHLHEKVNRSSELWTLYVLERYIDSHVLNSD